VFQPPVQNRTERTGLPEPLSEADDPTGSKDGAEGQREDLQRAKSARVGIGGVVHSGGPSGVPIINTISNSNQGIRTGGARNGPPTPSRQPVLRLRPSNSRFARAVASLRVTDIDVGDGRASPRRLHDGSANLPGRDRVGVGVFGMNRRVARYGAGQDDFPLHSSIGKKRVLLGK
jgi:hypothetical protein